MEKIPEARSIFKGDHADMLRDVEISQVLVYERLKRLKKNKAPGFDNLDSDFLSKTAESISNPLTKIFLNSFECGIVPADWKCANVCSIFKKGKKTIPGNYRSVSLTSHVCKVFEGMVKDKIIDHIDRHNLLNPSQHGFVKNKSCLTNLLETVSFLADCVDNHKNIDIVYLDFQKAFDKVPHKRLLLKIKSLILV